MFAARNMMMAVASGLDPDAEAYFAAVVVAGSTISTANKAAVNAFVVGCKADGIWAALKACCLLAGPDGLAGALVPLVGAAPTNVGPFVSGDYNRTNGLTGNGTKYLNTNRNNNSDPQNSQHVAVFPTLVGNGYYVGQATVSVASAGSVTVAAADGRCRNGTFDTAAVASSAGSLCGVTRAASGSHTFRASSTSQTFTRASQTPANTNVTILGFPANSAYATSRLSFYSIGEAIDLALLDARITTYMSALT